jgi:hypothetical protein
MIHAVLFALAAASPSPAPSVSPGAQVFRVVPISCGAGRLAIAGGGILRLAAGANCDHVVPGRAIAIAVDQTDAVTPQALAAGVKPASEIPKELYALAPSAAAEDDASDVIVTIDVTVPPRTPLGDDVYISTERSGYSPSELRMDRVDARRFRVALRIHRDARVAFRITRGSYQTTERDAAHALPPAHIAVGTPGLHVPITIAAWADID